MLNEMCMCWCFIDYWQMHILPKHPHITKPTHSQTHTLQNKLKQPQYKIYTKWISHNTINYPQQKVTPIFKVLLSPLTSPYLTSIQFTSLQNKNTSHKWRQVRSGHKRVMSDKVCWNWKCVFPHSALSLKHNSYRHPRN